MRAEFFRLVFGPITKALQFNCSCKSRSILKWCQELHALELWPIPETDEKSIYKLYTACDIPEYDPSADADCCAACENNFNVGRIADTRDLLYFNYHGLCLDCMNRSTHPNEEMRNDYWLRDKDREWDRGCTESHGKATWYFSYIGHPADMRSYVQMVDPEHRDILRELTSLDGPNGTNGIDGSNEINGSSGINGTNVIHEINEINGANGTNETNGINGTNGTNGTSRESRNIESNGYA